MEPQSLMLGVGQLCPPTPSLRSRSHRQVRGLRWAKLSPAHPRFPARQRHKAGSASAQGAAYERTVGKALQRLFGPRQVLLSQWIEFEDAAGHGWAQPDAIVLGPSPALVEVKRTHCLDAAIQLERTYLPLVRLVFGLEAWVMAEVAQNWVGPAESSMLEFLRDLSAASPGLHFIHLPQVR